MMNSTSGKVPYLNPAFTQVVTVAGPAQTLYIGGQDAVDASGATIGKGHITAQVKQAFENIGTFLNASGAELEHIDARTTSAARF